MKICLCCWRRRKGSLTWEGTWVRDLCTIYTIPFYTILWLTTSTSTLDVPAKETTRKHRGNWSWIQQINGNVEVGILVHYTASSTNHNYHFDIMMIMSLLWLASVLARAWLGKGSLNPCLGQSVSGHSIGYFGEVKIFWITTFLYLFSFPTPRTLHLN